MRKLIRLLGLLALAVSSTARPSPCSVSGGPFATITCQSYSRSVEGNSGDVREVKFVLPDTTEPSGGWPVVILYHGTGGFIQFSAPNTNVGPVSFGAYYQVQAIRNLVDHGYAVIAPPAVDRYQAWDSNDGDKPDVAAYMGKPDFQFLTNLFAKLELGCAVGESPAQGTCFGHLDTSRMHAAGLSSGGYNTSRMALNFADKFRSLTIVAASYATCSGYFCELPKNKDTGEVILPEDHLPTQFLHGGADILVPTSSMETYYNALHAQNATAHFKKISPGIGHQWTPDFSEQLYQWVEAHP